MMSLGAAAGRLGDNQAVDVGDALLIELIACSIRRACPPTPGRTWSEMLLALKSAPRAKRMRPLVMAPAFIALCSYRKGRSRSRIHQANSNPKPRHFMKMKSN